ncbi:MAG: hypothetical protein RL213_1585 [Bacteroidota bacterium]|jgi:hypothetical protein
MWKKITVRYGVAAGLLLSLLLFLPYALWGSRYYFELAEASAYGTILLTLAAAIFLGIRNRREKECGGTIPFSKAFSTGWTIALAASVIVYLCVYLFLELKGGEWMERYYQHRLEQLHTKYSDREVLLQKVAELEEDFSKSSKDHLNVNSQASMIFFIVLLFGTLISLASAGIQRRE